MKENIYKKQKNNKSQDKNLTQAILTQSPANTLNGSEQEDIFELMTRNQATHKTRVISIILGVLLCIVFLAFIWVGIGTLMQYGAIPYVDIGYSKLENILWELL